MIFKKNWQQMKKYLDYRLQVDQITKGSLKAEQSHMRYVLEWAADRSFREPQDIRPTLPEYVLAIRLNGGQHRLSAVYVKKTLATARQFFTWLADNENGYKHIKQAWIRTLKVKRITDAPKTREAVTLEEIRRIAAAPAHSLVDRRARAAAVFLYVSGMRIGAFVSLPLRSVDIASRRVMQYPSMGVKTKNRKYGVTYLLDIPDLLAVVAEWDSEVRGVLSPDGFWFAPLSPDTGQIDASATTIGEHREAIARKNMKAFIEGAGLQYHSPHKFRHGHIHYGIARAKTIEDFKAVSMNVLHSSMEITDQFYSNLNDDEIKGRIAALGTRNEASNRQDLIKALEDLLSNMKRGRQAA